MKRFFTLVFLLFVVNSVKAQPGNITVTITDSIECFGEPGIEHFEYDTTAGASLQWHLASPSPLAPFPGYPVLGVDTLIDTLYANPYS